MLAARSPLWLWMAMSFVCWLAGWPVRWTVAVCTGLVLSPALHWSVALVMHMWLGLALCVVLHWLWTLVAALVLWPHDLRWRTDARLVSSLAALTLLSAALCVWVLPWLVKTLVPGSRALHAALSLLLLVVHALASLALMAWYEQLEAAEVLAYNNNANDQQDAAAAEQTPTDLPDALLC